MRDKTRNALTGGAIALVLGGPVTVNPLVAQAAATITGADIKNGSVTSADLTDEPLLSAGSRAGQLPAGPGGATGSTGPTGAQGVPGRARRAAGS